MDELLEDNGDLENDQLSEVDEDGGHERATELPEDEVEDDDLNFAYGLGKYDPERTDPNRKPRFHDESDGDLDFLWDSERSQRSQRG